MLRHQYTAQEYANMHFIYGKCRGNANAAAALYRERYPNARHPDYRVFIRVHGCYSEGRMPGSGVGGVSAGKITRPDVEDLVFEEIENDLSTSTRAIARRTGIGKSTVHDILKKNEFHPYHVTRVQTLQLSQECVFVFYKNRSTNFLIKICGAMIQRLKVTVT
ncbi:unnamed protein product [Parnassius apollo]|uniref:(apollo) hypothetical protein n=1 Tax=Parnassius apollo TaxID=110799 RepID=A0A8S3W026_PARAO|nr:unnamed protein product [Parnassius apollo]